MKIGTGWTVLFVTAVAAVRAVAGQDMPTVTPRYGVVELTLTCPDRFDNPFRDAVCEAEFVSPSGKNIRVEGFYDGSDQWRVRFVPREHGNWSWSGRITGGAKPVDASGSFQCQGTQGHGFLRISPQNPFRYEYEDGTPFYPIGIQTCNFLQPDLDGPEVGTAENRWVSNTEWVQAFSGAVNLVRTQFGQGTTAGCALPLIAAPPKRGPGKEAVTNFVCQADRYDLALAARIDAVYRAQREAGISQILILFQDMSAWRDRGMGMKTAFGAIGDLAGCKSTKAPSLSLQEQYIRYVIARYGAFVDIWEIFNEDSYAPADYLAHLASVIRKADPYGRLLTSNFSRPGDKWSDITTWHEYMGMPANAVDTYVVSQIALHRSYGKLVQNTEFGNQGTLSNVDPVKWRLAVWSAFMQESSLLFWSMSQSKIPAGHVKGGNANAYIGPDSRQHFRVFHKITRDLPVDLRPVTIGFTSQTDIRTYALCNGKQGLIYVHHFADHGKPFAYPEKLMVQVGPGTWRLRWYQPEDGRELLAEEVSTPQQFLFFRIPEVTVDLVARVERIGEPEMAIVQDHLPPADPATLPDVPAIRPGAATDMVMDGRLDEAAWRSAPVHSEFGLDSGEGPSDFPTTVRFLRAGRALWVGIECDLPPPRDGGDVAPVLEKELLEVFLDNAGGRRMAYHIGLKPSGWIEIPGVATAAVPDHCECAVTRRPSGYTIELRLNLDAFDQLGRPNHERIGFNLARDSVKRWASLNGVIGQGQRPEQFWTLLLSDGGTEKPPVPAYRPLFREGIDLVALATNLLAGWDGLKGREFPGKPLMEVRMRQLAATVARSGKDRWGALVPLRSALYRGWLAQRELVPAAATGTVSCAVESALLAGVQDAFPEAKPSPGRGWRECAFVSSDDGSAQPYALFVPAGIPPGKRLALVVYLHGSGMGSFSDGLILERYQPPADFLIARVNARRCGRYHAEEKREIGEVIADIAAHWPVDTHRISLLGFSAGAFAVGELAVEQPGRFSAIAAVAGRFTTLGSGQAPALPVVAVWGRADPVVPFDPAEAARLLELVPPGGNEVSIYALPATDHAVPMSGLEYWLASRSRNGMTLPPAQASREQQLQILYEAGKEAAKAQDWATAEAKWKAALGLDPQSWEVLNHYAWFLVDTVPAERRDPDRALPMAIKANELTEGNNRDILDTLAEIWFQKKDYDRAVDFSRKALEPDRRGHASLKSLRRRLETFEKALADFKAKQEQPGGGEGARTGPASGGVGR